MRDSVTLLAILGGLFVVQAAVWGFLSAQSTARRLNREGRLIQAISEHNYRLAGTPGYQENKIDEKTLLEAAGIEHTSWHDVGQARQLAQAAIMEHVLKDFRGPGLLALLGVILGTIAGVWAIWL